MRVLCCLELTEALSPPESTLVPWSSFLKGRQARPRPGQDGQRSHGEGCSHLADERGAVASPADKENLQLRKFLPECGSAEGWGDQTSREAAELV